MLRAASDQLDRLARDAEAILPASLAIPNGELRTAADSFVSDLAYQSADASAKSFSEADTGPTFSNSNSTAYDAAEGTGQILANNTEGTADRIVRRLSNEADTKHLPEHSIPVALVFKCAFAVVVAVWWYLSPASLAIFSINAAHYMAKYGVYLFAFLVVILLLAPTILGLLANVFATEYVKRGVFLYVTLSPRGFQLVIRRVDLQPKLIALINASIPPPYSLETVRLGSLVLTISPSARNIELALTAPYVGFVMQSPRSVLWSDPQPN
jgi:hypothetical protein